jgi:hypothetical protein
MLQGEDKIGGIKIKIIIIKKIKNGKKTICFRPLKGRKPNNKKNPKKHQIN